MISMSLPSFLEDHGVRVAEKDTWGIVAVVALLLVFSVFWCCASVDLIRTVSGLAVLFLAFVLFCLLDARAHLVDDYLRSTGYVEWYYVKMKYGNPLCREGWSAYLVTAYDRDGREHEFVLLENGDGLYRRDM